MRISMWSCLCLLAVNILGALPPAPGWGQDGDVSEEAQQLKQAAKLYAVHCMACHFRGGKSRIRRLNLADDRWKHGSDLKAIEKTIAEGVEASQMQGFKNKLSAREISALAKYVLTFSARPAPSR